MNNALSDTGPLLPKTEIETSVDISQLESNGFVPNLPEHLASGEYPFLEAIERENEMLSEDSPTKRETLYIERNVDGRFEHKTAAMRIYDVGTLNLWFVNNSASSQSEVRVRLYHEHSIGAKQIEEVSVAKGEWGEITLPDVRTNEKYVIQLIDEGGRNIKGYLKMVVAS